MTSVATYRGYTFADNEVNLVNLNRRLRYSPRNKKMFRTDTLTCTGELIYADTSTIVSHIDAVESALSQDGGDFTYTVGGVLAHSLRNTSDCLTGVRVINRSFPKGTPEQLASTRSFSFTLQANYDVTGGDDTIQWQESIEVTGTGGPYWIVVETVFGPVRFDLSIATAQYYRQYGSAIGFSSYPVPPPPISYTGEFGYKRRITNTSGINQGTQIKFFRTSWAYYLAADPRNGTFTNTPTSK